MINLNLLTPSDKKSLKIEVAILVVKDTLLLMLAASAVISMLFVISKVILRKNYEEFIQESQTSEKQNPEFQQRVVSINTKGESLFEIQKTWVPVHGYLDALSSIISGKSRLLTVSVNTKEKIIFLTGFAPTRDEVLTIQEKLKSLSFVEEVKSPLSNILKEKDIDFSFEVKISTDTLP